MRKVFPRTFAMAGAMVICLMEVAYSDENGLPDLKAATVISAGHELYLEKHCSHCHGANGDGGINLTDRDLSNPNYVFEAIADGRERGSLRMPAWREALSEAQIWQVTAYVMSISRRTN
jgi:mono/diheme cytochrome c family protein